MQTTVIVAGVGKIWAGKLLAPWGGLRGRVGLEVEGRTVAVLQVEDGRVEVVHDDGPVQARAIIKREDDARRILCGEASVVVLALQGRLCLDGDTTFAIKVMHGLRAVSPRPGRPARGR